MPRLETKMHIWLRIAEGRYLCKNYSVVSTFKVSEFMCRNWHRNSFCYSSTRDTNTNVKSDSKFRCLFPVDIWTANLDAETTVMNSNFSEFQLPLLIPHGWITVSNWRFCMVRNIVQDNPLPRIPHVLALSPLPPVPCYPAIGVCTEPVIRCCGTPDATACLRRGCFKHRSILSSLPGRK